MDKEQPLKIDGTLDDVLRILVTPQKAPKARVKIDPKKKPKRKRGK